MFNLLDLKTLEKKAYRSVHQDGLLDILMGGIVASMAVLAYSNDGERFPFVRFSIFLAGMLISQLIFWAGKKYITVPRLGQVKFGPQRQKRKRTLVAVLSGIVLVQVVFVIASVLLLQHPEWARSLGLAGTGADRERLVVAVIGALFVGPSMAVIAYFNDFLRGYYIAFLISLGVFAYIWFSNSAFMIAAGLLVIIPGVVLFARFLRMYPRPPVEVTHG